ncbi:BDM_1a_G0047980.mRNA.1.CDS.1 [Saccharomyces cerevisiae]|nr:BDM_1a_G0047980.mRNA.1.CDS.1 [Saccharomyces cerevisiae]CAI7326216.1 BDM_1a_G0047980.mRNA.1.CDS.1 [Saccharomyces cerevisiae]
MSQEISYTPDVAELLDFDKKTYLASLYVIEFTIERLSGKECSRMQAGVGYRLTSGRRGDRRHVVVVVCYSRVQ